MHVPSDRQTNTAAPREQRAPQSPRVIMIICQAHGAAGFTNLLITKENGCIVLNPHLENCCVLRIEEQAARTLHNIFGEWLG